MIRGGEKETNRLRRWYQQSRGGDKRRLRRGQYQQIPGFTKVLNTGRK
jgi:hypothetical protein